MIIKLRSRLMILLIFQRRYTSSAIEDILLGQSKYICSENGVFVIRELSLEFGEKNPYNICLTSAEKYSSESKRMTRNQIKIRISSDDNKVKVQVRVLSTDVKQISNRFRLSLSLDLSV